VRLKQPRPETCWRPADAVSRLREGASNSMPAGENGRMGYIGRCGTTAGSSRAGLDHVPPVGERTGVLLKAMEK